MTQIEDCGLDRGALTRLSAEEDQRFKDRTGFRRQFAHAAFLFGPHQDAGAQAVRLDKALHETDLIDTDFQEEAGKFCQRLFAQCSAPVKVVAARQVAGGQAALVGDDIAAKAPRRRPDATGIQCLKQLACDISRATRPLPSRNG